MDWLPNIVRQYLLSFIQYPVIICCPPRKSERISEKRFSFLTIISPDELLFFLAFMSYYDSNLILIATMIKQNINQCNVRFKSVFAKCSVFHLLARVFRKHKAKWYFAGVHYNWWRLFLGQVPDFLSQWWDFAKRNSSKMLLDCDLQLLLRCNDGVRDFISSGILWRSCVLGLRNFAIFAAFWWISQLSMSLI